MKRIYILTAAAVLLCSCTPKQHRLIAPLPSGIDTENMQDCTVPAVFTSDDFRWDEGKLNMVVYSQDLYDAVEISQMQIGDTLIYESTPVVIESMVESHGGIDINGGLDEGGCCLAGYEGGTYIARNWDDHATYTEIGPVEVSLAEDFVIIDCGLDPQDPVDTIRTDQKAYLESLENSRRGFFVLNARVTIENGMLTEINRKWIP